MTVRAPGAAEANTVKTINNRIPFGHFSSRISSPCEKAWYGIKKKKRLHDMMQCIVTVVEDRLDGKLNHKQVKMRTVFEV